MSTDGTLILIVFLMTASLVMMIGLMATGGSAKLNARINRLTGRQSLNDQESVVQFARETLPKVGAALAPGDEVKRNQLQARLIHAGSYNRQAMYLFLGVKLIMMLGLPLIGVVLALFRVLPTVQGLLASLFLGVVGMIAPSFWLDHKIKKRQMMLRRSLPDALDVLVICLEGGLSLQGALKRVTTELRGVHAILAGELRIVDREIQLGRAAGESLWHMAERTGLEEILNLAGVISQADRFGASLVKSLRVHADTLRERRRQRAEEMAQKASTKILFPTLLFIFPAIFVVILGPAAIQIAAMLSNTGLR